MAMGFKVADGYVEVHAKYDKGELRKAAQQAADDNDREFNRERDRNSRSSATRNVNRRIGGRASDDFVRGMREQIARQKDSPFITLDGLRKDMTRLGRVTAHHYGDAFHNEVIRDRRWSTIGARLRARFRGTFRDLGHISAGNFASSFFRSFIESVSFGQADIGGAHPTTAFARWASRIGTALGVTLAGALVLQVANAITALLPVALGGALLAVPIADLIFRNVSLEKGKLSFKNTAVGKALEEFIRGAQALADRLGKVFTPAFTAGLKGAASLLKAIQEPLARVVETITPAAVSMWNGLLTAVRTFGHAFAPAIPGIVAGLKEWGIQLPKIGKAFGDMFAIILRDPALVRKAVQGLSGLLQGLMRGLGHVISFLTYSLAGLQNMWRLVELGFKNSILPQWLSRVTQAWGPLGRAIKRVWEAFKSFATASNDQEIVNRFHTLVRRIKEVWGPLKKFLHAVWKLAWDAIRTYFNEHVKPWIENTLKPWLQKKLKEAARWAFNALVEAAKKELKKLPGKAQAELEKLKQKIKDKLKQAVEAAKQKAKDLVDKVVDWFKKLPGRAASAVSSLWSKMKGKFSDAVSNAKNKAKDLVDGVIKKLKELPGKAASEVGKAKDKIKGKFSSAGSWLVSAGKDIARGLADGISAGLSWVTSAAKRLAEAAKNAAKSALGISSPSKVFMEEVGRPSAEGFAEGLRKNLPKEMPGMRAAVPALVGAGQQRTVSNSWSPTIILNVNPAFDTVNAAARRAITKDLFLALEQYRKDYVTR